MGRKWLIAIPLIIALLGLCGVMIGIVYFTMPVLNRATPIELGKGFRIHLQVNDTKAETDRSQTFPVGSPAALVVRSGCGSVQVVGGEVDQINAAVHLTAWGKDEVQAQQKLEQIQVSMVQEGDSVTVEVVNVEEVCNQESGPLTEIEFTIGVPAQTQVQIDSDTGRISVEGLQAKAVLATKFGDIEVNDLKGPLEAQTSNGRIQALEVLAGSESIHLKSNFGEIDLKRSAALKLLVETDNGAINLEEVQIEQVNTVTSQFGEITWHGGSAREASLYSTNGAITLENLNLDGGLKLDSDFGALRLTNVKAASYNLSSLNGEIVVNEASGPVKAQSDFGEISITNAGENLFDLTSKNGAITFEGALAGGESKAASEFGGVRILLPVDSDFEFDLQTEFGTILSDFTMTIEGKLDEHHWQGQVGSGGPLLTVKTNNGNITLKKRGE